MCSRTSIHLFDIWVEAFFELVRIAAEHVDGGGLLLQQAGADAHPLVAHIDGLVLPKKDLGSHTCLAPFPDVFLMHCHCIGTSPALPASHNLVLNVWCEQSCTVSCLHVRVALCSQSW